MPRRKQRARANSVTPQEIERLRRAIHEGYPWIIHAKDNIWRHSGLPTRLSILLSYVTGISAGAAIFLGGSAHPSKETVATVKAELQDDIDEAEKRYKNIFNGRRRTDSFFRYVTASMSARPEF